MLRHTRMRSGLYCQPRFTLTPPSSDGCCRARRLLLRPGENTRVRNLATGISASTRFARPTAAVGVQSGHRQRVSARRGGCIAFGEVIFDCFEDGTAVIGGSPLNFAVGLRTLGFEVEMVSSLGDDDLGQQALSFLADQGVGSAYVHPSTRPTGQVAVTIVDGEPQYDVDLDASWQQIQFPAQAAHGVRPELLYIGSTARQTDDNAATVRGIVSKLRPVHVMFDLNLRPGMYNPESVVEGLALATMVKMNDEEWSMLKALGVDCATPADLVKAFSLDLLAITKGEKGASLYSAKGDFASADGVVATVVDTVGAGDAFSAVLAAEVMRNGLCDLDSTLKACNAAGAAAVCHQGALGYMPADRLRASQLHGDSGSSGALYPSLQTTQMQLALDLVSILEAKDLYSELEASGAPPEIVEVGTPVVIQEGMKAVTALRAHVSDSVAVLADLKIMDAGEHEANLAFSAGADIVTVLGVAHDETIQGVVRAARRAGGGTKEVMVDLINTADPAARAAQVVELGVDIVCVHTAFDVQGHADPLNELRRVNAAVGAHATCVEVTIGPSCRSLPRVDPATASWHQYSIRVGETVAVACAGGVKDDGTCMEALMEEKPDIIVVGGFIGNADCKVRANSDIRRHFLSKEREPGGRIAAPRSDMSQDASSMLSTIVGELRTSTAAVSSTQVENLVQQLIDVDRIFVCGMGRSGFAMRGLAMRLSHLGLAAHFVGEVTTPPIGPRDLLLLGSGSGGTASLVNHAQTAVKVGASVSLLTVDAGSPLGQLSVETDGVIVTLPAPTPKLEGGGATCGVVPSAQPMGTLFEQTLGLTCDAVVLLLMRAAGQGSDEMFKRHANME